MLDQGYWSDGLLTPASPACFADDIRAMKALGFNTLRKHLKVEPELFYYACDRLGMVVFQDMVNNGDYDIHRDLELPNSGLLRLDDRALHPEPDIRAEFLRAMELTGPHARTAPVHLLLDGLQRGLGPVRQSGTV